MNDFLRKSRKISNLKNLYEITTFTQNKDHEIQTTFLHHEWHEFYPPNVTPPSTENNNFFNYSRYENLRNEQAISFLSDLYVLNCYFSSITYSNHGAAISLSARNSHFLVEFSTFFECSTTGIYSPGGGLYIDYADFAMNHVCAIECSSSSDYSFTDVTNSGRTVNSIYHSSIAYCFAKNYYTMGHNFGYIDIQSVNLSHNTAVEDSALTCWPSSTKDDIGTCISYSSFADNNATSQDCIYLGSGGVNVHKIHESNVIYNTQPMNTITTTGTLTIQFSTIEENKGSPVFSGSITLINCSVSDDQYKDASSLNTNEVTTNSFINELTFITTGYCGNLFDSHTHEVFCNKAIVYCFLFLSLFVFLFMS